MYITTQPNKTKRFCYLLISLIATGYTGATSLYSPQISSTLKNNPSLQNKQSTLKSTKANLNNNDAKVKLLATQLMQKYQIPGVAVILYKDGQMHRYYFGVMDKATQKPVDENTIFELGSVTKTFSGLLLAYDVLTQKVRLDDKFTRYILPNTQYSQRLKDITLLELATHTSSLPYDAPNIRYNAPTTPKNLQKLTTFMHSWASANYTPGHAMTYSNLGFSLLGMALSNYPQNKPFVPLQEQILNPLKMSNSFYKVPANMQKYYAQGYSTTGTTMRSPYGGFLAGSWALKASVNDMGTYLAANLGLGSFARNLSLSIKIAQTGYYQFANGHTLGLGWMITPLTKENINELLTFKPYHKYTRAANEVVRIANPKYSPNVLIEKTGATDGFRAYIAIIPKTQTGVVILANKFIIDNTVIEHVGRQLVLE